MTLYISKCKYNINLLLLATILQSILYQGWVDPYVIVDFSQPLPCSILMTQITNTSHMVANQNSKVCSLNKREILHTLDTQIMMIYVYISFSKTLISMYGMQRGRRLATCHRAVRHGEGVETNPSATMTIR